MKNYDQIFNDSYERIMYRGDQGDAFFTQFYQSFVESSVEVQQIFAKVDMTRQKLMMQRSLYMAMDFASSRIETETVRKYAHIHGRSGHAIPLHLYDLWLENLIDTVRIFDPKCDLDVELAWRLVLTPLIQYMTAEQHNADKV